MFPNIEFNKAAFKYKMTEEEAFALDEEITNADIILKQDKDGIFTRQRELLDALDRASADYIITRAIATNKMPMQILGEMVHEKIVAGVSA
ncbi:MAG: hypothetical protein FWB77_04735 [Treponema sp.]|nr:hypothetical protein [Treponema sp.]